MRRPVPGPAALPTLLLLLAAVAPAAPAAADPAPFVRFLGGGSPRTDCMLVTDVAGGVGSPRGRRVRCEDGDPTCDADGVADGRCVLRVRLCLQDTAAAGCHADVVTHAAVASPLPALAEALAALVPPITVPDTCTVTVDQPVPTGPRRAGRARLVARATMASGHADRDRLTLLCRPRPRRATVPTFAVVQRRVLAPSCASSSCHGDARAGGLGLGAAEAWANLVGAPATNPAAAAAALRRVVPGDPGASFLLRKLTGPLGPAEGARMPRTGGGLDAATIDLVARWIAAGAPR
jgi:hypothetical protein